eukprot:8204397-Pyramimonas_sp.AAC.1
MATSMARLNEESNDSFGKTVGGSDGVSLTMLSSCLIFLTSSDKTANWRLCILDLLDVVDALLDLLSHVPTWCLHSGPKPQQALVERLGGAVGAAEQLSAQIFDGVLQAGLGDLKLGR